MASLQIGATPVEDVITETEATSKEPQAVAPPPLPPAEPVHTLDIEDEEGLQDLTVPPFEEKIDNYSDDDGERENEYRAFMEKEDAAPPFRPAGEPAPYGDFDEDDDPEDEDDELI